MPEPADEREPHHQQVVTFLSVYAERRRPSNREELVIAFCHMQRAANGSSECEFCGNVCMSGEAAACDDLALALADYLPAIRS